MNGPPAGVEAAVDRLVDALSPKAVYLYGSYARGTEGPDSDIDLLVVVDADDGALRALSIEGYRALVGLGVPIELKVVTSEEFDRRSTWRSSVERAVREEGVVLYERAAG